MQLGNTWCWFMVLAICSAEKWRFPETESIRIDSKVRFTQSDQPSSDSQNSVSTRDRINVQLDEIPVREPSEADGFYNQPSSPRRYPSRVEVNSGSRLDLQRRNYNQRDRDRQRNPMYESDGTLDSLQVCKCSPTPSCGQRSDSSRVCGANMYLCCYSEHKQRPSEYFNELVDERPMLLPGQFLSAGPFPPPPDTLLTGHYEPGHAHEAALLSAMGSRPGILVGPQGPKEIFNPAQRPTNVNSRPSVLVGPDGLTGIFGPNNKQILVGPDGPTGIIGPTDSSTGNYEPTRRPFNNNVNIINSSKRPVLVGPNGPTGIVGPTGSPTGIYGDTRRPFNNEGNTINSSNRPVLVGPEGPTGVIGPSDNPSILVGPNGPTGTIGPSQKPVLVGPEGPTGIIGPNEGTRLGGYRDPQDVRPSETAQRPVLVGPGGPTGIIGPGYNPRGVLVGPGGPTGVIGPGRPVLIGPGGPTGVIGPNYGRQYPGGRRPILVGPGGPTGRIGPYGNYGK
ncbi:unnamed protein product [Parnassius apollo]|uniref:(apollo) hypothetical protein n=1 Tax=Parnassius apollo TaxID=110799 RepID=A0A8S3Y5S5_PARAO|nr:unnamed protein product [Parnassius apollo]